MDIKNPIMRQPTMFTKKVAKGNETCKVHLPTNALRTLPSPPPIKMRINSRIAYIITREYGAASIPEN